MPIDYNIKEGGLSHMKADLEEKYIHGSALFPFQYFHSHTSESVNLVVPCHWHTNLEILYVESGSFLVVIDGNIYTGHTGDIFFINTEQLHQITSTEQGSSYYSFVFSLKNLYFQENDYAQTLFLEPVQEKLWFPAQLKPENPCYNSCQKILATMQNLSQERPTAWQLLTKAELYGLIAVFYQYDQFILKNQQGVKTHSPVAMRMKEVLQYIAVHYKENITLKQAASIMHMTPKYFSNYFSTIFCTSFIQYMNRYRIEQAAILLQTTSLPVMEVAFEVGYENFSYFIRRFKEFQGCTPSDYRKKLNPHNIPH